MLIWIWRSRAQYSRGTPVAARRRSWRAGAHRVAPLILVVLALGAGALSAQVRPHARAGFATDGLRWPGNTVLGRSRPKQLMVVQEPGPAGPYRVALLTSQDDGRSWQPQAVVTDVEADDFYDPALVQAPDSSLLTCAHSNGELRFFRSQDEGRTWARHATVLPPEGSAYAECYPRALTGSSLLVAYGAFERAAGVTRYEARVSRDSGRTWGEPTLLGSGGRIRDAMRPGVSSQARDGSLLVVFAYRDSADGPVSVLGRRVEGAGVAAGPVQLLGRTPPLRGDLGVYPVVLRCGDTLAVLISEWSRPDARGWFTWLGDGAAAADRVFATQELAASNVREGFGRAWLSRTWTGSLVMTYVEVRTPTLTQIRQVEIPCSVCCEP